MRVLILCTHNSARSQMAEGLLRHLGGKDFTVFSAGTEATRVNPLAIRVMDEIGIDITGQYSKSLTQFLGQPLDVVITVCDQANESCPLFPGAPTRIHWSFPDPSAVQGAEEERIAAFRRVRMALTDHLQRFIDEQRATSIATVGVTTESASG